jgi:hypothetical protein
VQVEILGTGVAIRPATDAEVLLYRRARADEALELDFSFVYGPVATAGEIYVVARTFVEFRHEGRSDRWESGERHGMTIPTDRDPTADIVAIAADAEDMADLIGDMGIAGMKVSRLAWACAPRRIELDRSLTSGGMFE